MTEYATKHNTAITDIQPFIPVEAALMGSLMTIATILVPPATETTTHANSLMLVGFSGFLLFLVAKFSLIPSGRMATWGPRPMRPPFKLAYVLGYLLMIAGGVAMTASAF